MQVSPQQVYQEVLAQGGDTTQAQVAAALVDGIESDGDPTELSGGIGPAQGLFQFEPGTWTGSAGGGKGGLPGTVGAATWQQQVTGFLNATRGNNFGAWGPDLVANRGDPNSSSNPAYGYSGGVQAGSEVANKIASLNLGGGGGATPVDGGGSPTAASQAAAPTPTRTEMINGQSFTGTDDQLSAQTQAEQLLQQYGLGGLAQWSWNEITSGADNNAIALDIQNTPEFQSAFPGIVAQKNYNAANPNNPVPVMSVTDYLSYESHANQAVQAAGLPPGMLNKDLIGQLIAGNVSTSEFDSRINDAVALAYNSPQEAKSAMNAYFGVQDFGAFSNGSQQALTTGQIAALALDPNIAEPLIKNQINAAQIGGAFQTAGLGIAAQGGIDAATAMQLTQAGVTQSEARDAAKTLGPLAPLEAGLPGQSGATTVSANSLATGNLLGDTNALRAQQVAEETRKGPFSGGGGYASNAKGTVGTGSASSQGVGNA